MVKLRNLQSALLAVSGPLVFVGAVAVSLTAHAADVAVSGVVRDSSGVPQMDAMVQLLRADSTVIRTVRTDAHGTFLIAGVMPGVYQLKAFETSFLPTLRENLRLTRGVTEANLTLSTLMEALSWLPIQKRGATEPQDDWTWTLRSAAYRPLLRYVGPNGLETIETGENATPQNRGRLIIESGTRTFADAGAHESMDFQHRGSRDGQMMLHAAVSDSTGGPATLTAGYSQQNAVGSGLTTVASFQSDPGLTSGSGTGMQMASLRSVDTLQILPEVVIEGGSQLQFLSLGTQTLTRIQPFANVTWTSGENTASYTMSTTPRVEDSAHIADAVSYASLAGEQNGVLRVEHGLHQELKLEHAGPSVSASVAFYDDRVEDPVIDAMGSLANADFATGDYLFDPDADIARAMGPEYSSRGVLLEFRHQGPTDAASMLRSMYEAVEYASGSALKAPENVLSGAFKASFSPVFHAEKGQSVAFVMGGKAPHSGTTWQAAYRMQPGNSVTAVDLFDTGMADAYLSILLRQPLHRSRIFPGGVDAVVNVRNLLAQGYHPFLTSDGNTLFFAQVDRSVQGGLAFYF